MRWTVRLLLLITLAALTAVVLAWLLTAVGPASNTTIRHTGPTIEQVAELSELVSLRVDVADVLESRVDGRLGGMRVAMVIKGDVLLSTDLSRARFERVDQISQQAVLVLPQPRPASVRVDHDPTRGTRVVAVADEALWMAVPGDNGRSRVVDRAYVEAQQAVAKIGAEPKYLDQARRRAEQVIGSFFRATGWTVRVRWE